MAVASEAVMTFRDIVRDIYHVPGWLSEPEASVLYDAALSTPPDGVIVEIGSFAGRSTRLLAATGRTVFCVDPLELGRSVGKIIIDDAIVASLQAAADLPNVHWQRAKSTTAKYPPHIDLVYIDACHKYPFPLTDFRVVEPSLTSGSLVAFHDYHHEHGVTRTVLELERANSIKHVGGAQSMYLGVYS